MIKYIKNRETLCHKCLQDKEDIKNYSIYGRGYGSYFDNDNETVQLCSECRSGIEEDLDKWFNESCEYDGYYENYKYEEELCDFINELPIQGREIVVNQTSYGACAEHLDSQDWIDIELEIADDEVYKRNGMYSPSEIKAYEDRFPTCKHTYLKVWSDGSSGTRCSKHPFVSGNKDFTCSNNISTECYYCDDYEKKDVDYVHDVETQLIVKPKLVNMYEIFCPNCGSKMLKYKHQIKDEDDIYCDKCFKELVIEI